MTTLSRTLAVSCAAHLVVFGLFSFSFQRPLFDSFRPALVFWAQRLPGSVFLSAPGQTALRPIVAVPGLARSPEQLPLPSDSRSVYVKPQGFSALFLEKPRILQPPLLAHATPPMTDTSITFHPLLPYQLQLYFKDRQAVHIELLFSIGSSREKHAIQIRRKISSGNLEADLLSARYITHYLFIQRSRFIPDTWQTVKIDLSSGNDQP